MPPQLFRVADAAALLALQPSTVRSVRISESEILRIQRDGTSPRREEVRS
jgi:hypothetical protein